MINAISPIDGRYASKTEELAPYFSEAALIKYRIRVEIEYFLFLHKLSIINLTKQEQEACTALLNIDSPIAAARIKEIEKTTNHDVKAVEYYIKEALKEKLRPELLEYVHFGLTSQDINNTAVPLSIQASLQTVLIPQVEKLIKALATVAEEWKNVALLAHTHGQPASPTTLGKEIMVFVDRLNFQFSSLRDYKGQAKFGGATGNFNAHKLAFPAIDWPQRANELIASLGLSRQQWTTQIEHYDHMASLFHNQIRINNILIDLCRDIWTYISMNYFGQKTKAGEIGSSAMPHKVNPIDFENAEGNLGFANAIFDFLAQKLPVSRLQRDLTDSTVSRNIGVPFAHTLIAIKSIQKGLEKLILNESKIKADLEAAWAVVAEGIQTILRREGVDKPYELLKEFSRGKGQLTQQDFLVFIDTLPIADAIKIQLRAITPHNYIGYKYE